MDIYSLGYLNGVVLSLKRTPAFLLNTFFKQILTAEEDTIYFDVETDGTKRRLAPIVHPLVPGKLVESRGYETKSLKPAYIKDLRVHDATRPFKRTIGEQIGTGGSMTMAQRAELAIRMDLRDQVDMLTRRLEVWASQILRTGTLSMNMKMPDGAEKAITLNFGRHADLTITLGSGTYWGEAGVDPVADLEEWSLDVLQKSGSSVRTIVMDSAAWGVFRTSTLLNKKLDLLRVKSGEIDLGSIPDHVQYKGNDGTFDYWVYADWYLADGASVETPMLPKGTVLGIGDIMGVRHFGAIKDERAGFQAMEYFSKSWLVEDPSVRNLLLQSAPVLAPYRPNAGFAATVLAP
jgi:hypothetical protein